MSILSAGQWTTDFVCSFVDISELQTKKKNDLERFLHYALRENPGVIALWACLEGLDIYTSLYTFCGINTNVNISMRTQRKRKDTCGFNVEKFGDECKKQKISRKRIGEMLGVSRGCIDNIFIKNQRRKRRQFIEAVEDALKLERGSLLLEKQ